MKKNILVFIAALLSAGFGYANDSTTISVKHSSDGNAAAPEPEIKESPKKGKFSYTGFSGGMMLHAGYIDGGTLNIDVNGTNASQEMRGLTKGIGGAIKLHFGNNFRAGSEGYVSTLKFGEYGSQASVGWGGVCADYIWRLKRVSPFIGLTIGGGTVKYTALVRPAGNTLSMDLNASYAHYTFMALTPFAGIEYTLNSHMRFVLKADWVSNISHSEYPYPAGPRFYIGFSFYRH